MGDGCLLHQHRRLVPIERVPLRPVSRGGPTGGPVIEVCANSAAMVYELLERIEGYASAGAQDTAREVLQALPPTWWRIFPAGERAVAYRIWLRYGDAFLRGVLADWVVSWHPDGRARLPGTPSVDDLSAVAGWPARLRRRLAEL